MANEKKPVRRSQVARWDPFSELEEMRNRLARMFDFASPVAWSREDLSPTIWAPPVDVKETDDKYTIEMDLPGVKPEDVDVQVTGDTVVIKGERKFEQEEEKEGYHRIERSYGSFQRAFTLGNQVDADNIKASLKHGVLTVELPKAPEAKAKKIEIDVEK